MNLEIYQSLKPGIRLLDKGNYALSYTVIGLNLAFMAISFEMMASFSPVIYLSGCLLLALQMNHSYVIMHECTHSSLVRGIKTNEVLGNIFAFTCLYPFYIKRFEHLQHHRFTGGYDEPVAKKAVQNFSVLKPSVHRLMSICWKLWVPVFTANELYTTWQSSIESVQKKWRLTAIFSLALYAAAFILIVLLLPNWGAFLLKIFLAIYLYMIGLEFFTMPHHVPSVIDERQGTVPNYEQTRYTQSCAAWPEPLATLYMLNFNYHVAHHLFPFVHWTNLRKANDIIEPHLPGTPTLRSELAIMLSIRRRSFQDVFAKYYRHQEEKSE